MKMLLLSVIFSLSALAQAQDPDENSSKLRIGTKFIVENEIVFSAGVNKLYAPPFKYRPKPSSRMTVKCHLEIPMPDVDKKLSKGQVLKLTRVDYVNGTGTGVDLILSTGKNTVKMHCEGNHKIFCDMDYGCHAEFNGLPPSVRDIGYVFEGILKIDRVPDQPAQEL